VGEAFRRKTQLSLASAANPTEKSATVENATAGSKANLKNR
jgi:hypothetical protein